MVRRVQVLVLLPRALRERLEDVLPIARALVAEHARREIAFTATLASRLLGHPWPGNVRELDSVVHRLVVEFGHEEVLPSPPWLQEGLAPVNPAQPEPSIRPHERLPGRRSPPPDDEELDRVMRRFGGNVSAVADALGVSRNTVYRWLRRAGLVSTMFRRK